MRESWRRRAGTALARNTLWVAIGQVLRIVTQAIYFVLIARALGSRDYGAYVGVLAVAAVAAPFASLGSGFLLIKHVARTPSVFPRQWGRALATTLLSGTLLLGVVAIVGRFWLPASIPLELVLVVGAADLLFVRLIEVGAQAYQAHQRLSRTAFLQVLVSPLRLLAATILITVTTAPTALDWGIFYLLTSIVGAGIAVVLVNRELGTPDFHVGDLGSELREGFFFSVSLSAQSSTNDIDKAMLARLGTLEATGVYAAAYRVVDMAFLPVGALLVAAYARFFQHGVKGVLANARFARPLLSLSVSYGLLASTTLYLLASALPAILGPGYREAGEAVRWLAVLPLLKAIHYFGADSLTGAGHQGVRTVVQVTIAVVNVLLNVWLIPLYSWRGAAVATVVSDGLLGVAIWTTVWYLGRQGRRLEPAVEGPSVVEVG